MKRGDQLYNDKLARIHWATPDEEPVAFEYFKRAPGPDGPDVCTVDCLSLIVMEKETVSVSRRRVGSSWTFSPIKQLATVPMVPAPPGLLAQISS